MATKTWYLDSKNFGGSTTYAFFTGDLSQISSGVNHTNTGWNMGRNGAGNYALMDNGNEVSRNNFSSGTPSSSTSTNIESNSTFNNTYNDTATTIVPVSGISLAFPYNAQFDTGSWSLNLDVRADNRSWQNGAGRIIGKMWYSVFNSNGTWTQSQISTSENGTGWVNGSTISNLTTSTEQTCSMTLTPTSALTLAANKSSSSAGSNQCGYLTFELAWEITTAIAGRSVNNNCDAMLQTGTNTSSELISPAFRKKIYATQ